MIQMKRFVEKNKGITLFAVVKKIVRPNYLFSYANNVNIYNSLDYLTIDIKINQVIPRNIF